MWWQYIVGVIVAAVAIYGFVLLVRTMTGNLTRKTERRAEDLYDQYGSTRKHKHRHSV